MKNSFEQLLLAALLIAVSINIPYAAIGKETVGPNVTFPATVRTVAVLSSPLFG